MGFFCSYNNQLLLSLCSGLSLLHTLFHLIQQSCEVLFSSSHKRGNRFRVVKWHQHLFFVFPLYHPTHLAFLSFYFFNCKLKGLHFLTFWGPSGSHFPWLDSSCCQPLHLRKNTLLRAPCVSLLPPPSHSCLGWGWTFDLSRVNQIHSLPVNMQQTVK